jgi:hypothetical protein
METIHKEKEKKIGYQISFVTEIDSHRSFTPRFGFALPVPCITGAYSSLIKPVQNKTLN